jgi:hypothetical protein
MNYVNYLISKIAAINANTNTSIADHALRISARVNHLLYALTVIGTIHKIKSTIKNKRGIIKENKKYET